MQNDRNSLTRIRFSRPLSSSRVIARGVSIVVFFILFSLLGDVMGVAGPWAPLAILLAGLVAVVNVLGYIELSMRTPCCGGAYVQVREARGGWMAFLVGWGLILSGFGACALLADTFSLHVTTLLHDYLGVTVPAWPFAVGLVVLVSLNNALGTTGGRRGWTTLLVLLMVLLSAIVLVAFPQIQVSRYGGDYPDWERTLPFLMVSFIGIEVVAGLQEEIRQRKRRILSLLLLTPVLSTLVAALLSLVVIGVVGSETFNGSQMPLALLGERLFQGGGRPLVLVIGAVGSALAFNKGLVLVVRRIYLMSSHGYWPSRLHRSHPRFGTPIWAILVFSVILIPLTAVPAILLTRLAGLLYLLVLIGVNFVLALQPQSDTSAFNLPFHPWVPTMILAIDIILILLWDPLHVGLTLVSLAVGVALYFAYSRTHHIESQAGVTVFKPEIETEKEVDYHVLVPIANPLTAGSLLRLAGTLAQQRGGEVVALHVVTVPNQIPLEEGRHRAQASQVLLERATLQAEEEGFKFRSMTRVAHDAAQGIVDTAQEEEVDLVLLGWRGYTRSAGASMGPVIDAVVRDSPCAVTVAKGDEWRGARKILVPTSGGPHAPIAAQLALSLSKAYGAEVTILNVQLGRATSQQMEENRRLISQTIEGLEFERPPEQKVVVAESVVEGVVHESEGYDLVLLGASEEGLFDQFVFGNIPQQIAARVPKTVVIVRRYGGATERFFRRIANLVSRVLIQLDIEEQLELREELSDSARPGVSYLVLIVLSCIIATQGLLLDSTAVVIGAMLVAPLMSPILGFSLGLIVGDVRMIRLSVEAVLKGVALALLIAVFVGLLSPFKELTDEILSRTQPTLLDLIVALASGMAGAYALARKEVSAALPGVAIAAALMPPLCVTGVGLSLGQPQVAGGAFLLFVANIISISLAGVVVFILLGVRPESWLPAERRRLRRGVIGVMFLILLVAIPLAVIMGNVLRETRDRQIIQEVLEVQAQAYGGELVEVEYRIEEEKRFVVATMRPEGVFSQMTVDRMAATLERRLEEPVVLDVILLPVLRSGE